MGQNNHPNLRGHVILHLEDELSLAQVLNVVFRRHGAHYHWYANQEAYLSAAREHLHTPGVRFLVDDIVPLSGFDPIPKPYADSTIARLRALGVPDTAIIVYSGTWKQTPETMAIRRLVKPATLDEIFSALSGSENSTE